GGGGSDAVFLFVRAQIGRSKEVIMSGSNGKNKESSSGISTEPLPASKKVYAAGRQAGVRVAMREIAVAPTREGFSPNGRRQPNLPVTVYDTSGPYTDQQTQIDLRKGLAALRGEWIRARGDAEEIKGSYRHNGANGTE